MPRIRKLAAILTAAGLAAFGTVAAGGGVASAATDQSVTGCDTGSSALLGLNTFPTCTSPTSTVVNPTSVTIKADPSFFNTLNTNAIKALLTLLGQQLAENVTYTLACRVDGTTVNFDGSFQATTDTSTQTQVVDLQAAVGSPSPNSCQVQNLKATSLVSLSSGLLLLLGSIKFTFGVSATANTGVPGAIWMSTGKNGAGASTGTCVDVANNGNAGSKVQAYQCNSDLAQSWIQTNGGQLVRNGDCLTQQSTKAVLAKCSGTNNAQKWTVNGTGGHFNTIVNHSTSQCLTASSPANFTQLTVTSCTGAANQRWTGPAKSPA